MAGFYILNRESTGQVRTKSQSNAGKAQGKKLEDVGKTFCTCVNIFETPTKNIPISLFSNVILGLLHNGTLILRKVFLYLDVMSLFNIVACCCNTSVTYTSRDKFLMCFTHLANKDDCDSDLNSK